MDPKKYLIVNADDFGQSPGVNWGIIEAHKHGIVTSASLMTRWVAAGEAALHVKEHPKLSLGLHLDMGEWIWRNQSWVPLYTVVPLEDKSAVEREVHHQLDLFRYLVGMNPATSIRISMFTSTERKQKPLTGIPRLSLFYELLWANH